MSARRILIVYGTTHGHTATVARRVADLLAATGHSVALANADVLPPGVAPDAFDGVVVASNVMFGRHRRSVARFVRLHRDALGAVPSALLSISGSAASPLPAVQAQARRSVDQLLRETGWSPAATELVGGELAYTRYNPLLRWVMARISRKEGRPVDTARDHDLTDWAQVRRFADAFGATVDAHAEGHVEGHVEAHAAVPVG